MTYNQYSGITAIFHLLTKLKSHNNHSFKRTYKII